MGRGLRGCSISPQRLARHSVRHSLRLHRRLHLCSQPRRRRDRIRHASGRRQRSGLVGSHSRLVCVSFASLTHSVYHRAATPSPPRTAPATRRAASLSTAPRTCLASAGRLFATTRLSPLVAASQYSHTPQRSPCVARVACTPSRAKRCVFISSWMASVVCW